MADEFIPELTLNPNSPLGSQAQAAPPKGADTPQQPASAPQDGVPDTDLDEAKLTPAQRKAVEAFAKTIDITDSNVVLQYGAAAQKNVSEFSENTLQQIRTKDLGEIGDTLSTWSASSRTSTRGRRRRASPASSGGRRTSWPP